MLADRRLVASGLTLESQFSVADFVTELKQKHVETDSTLVADRVAYNETVTKGKILWTLKIVRLISSKMYLAIPCTGARGGQLVYFI